MSSSRLPGKVLKPVKGKLLLVYIIDRLSICNNIGDIMIATSTNTEDDAIADYCFANKIKFYRGMLNDVAGRFLRAAKINCQNSFIRINGDSPFIDPEIVDKAIAIYQSGEFDLVTNTYPRSYPIGQSVEVIRVSSLSKAYKKMTKPEELEHVTKYFYSHSSKYNIHNFKNDSDLSNYRLVVDTSEDMKRIQQIVSRMKKPHYKYSMNDIIEMYPHY